MKKEIIFCVGIPASGKSTWSKNFVKTNSDYVRVCRDDYRYMFKDIGWFEGKDIRTKLENLITQNIFSDIINLLNNDFNVVVDETNLDYKRLIKLIKDLRKTNSFNVKFKLFNITFKEAYERDLKRERTVGEQVLLRMIDKHDLLMKNLEFNKTVDGFHIVDEINF